MAQSTESIEYVIQKANLQEINEWKSEARKKYVNLCIAKLEREGERMQKEIQLIDEHHQDLQDSILILEENSRNRQEMITFCEETIIDENRHLLLLEEKYEIVQTRYEEILVDYEKSTDGLIEGHRKNIPEYEELKEIEKENKQLKFDIKFIDGEEEILNYWNNIRKEIEDRLFYNKIIKFVENVQNIQENAKFDEEFEAAKKERNELMQSMVKVEKSRKLKQDFGDEKCSEVLKESEQIKSPLRNENCEYETGDNSGILLQKYFSQEKVQHQPTRMESINNILLSFEEKTKEFNAEKSKVRILDNQAINLLEATNLPTLCDQPADNSGTLLQKYFSQDKIEQKSTQMENINNLLHSFEEKNKTLNTDKSRFCILENQAVSLLTDSNTRSNINLRNSTEVSKPETSPYFKKPTNSYPNDNHEQEETFQRPVFKDIKNIAEKPRNAHQNFEMQGKTCNMKNAENQKNESENINSRRFEPPLENLYEKMASNYFAQDQISYETHSSQNPMMATISSNFAPRDEENVMDKENVLDTSNESNNKTATFVSQMQNQQDFPEETMTGYQETGPNDSIQNFSEMNYSADQENAHFDTLNMSAMSDYEDGEMMSPPPTLMQPSAVSEPAFFNQPQITAFDSGFQSFSFGGTQSQSQDFFNMFN